MGWSFPCDIWSIGCLLVELYTGTTLFQTHDNLEHLKMMEIVLGTFPNSFIRHLSPEKNNLLFKKGRVKYPTETTEKSSKDFLNQMLPISSIISPRNDFEEAFLDLIRSMLLFDPDDRITAHEALGHPFFKM
jgi:dual-specificity kinase